MISLFEKINQDMIKALKAGEKVKTSVLRGLKLDIKYRQIDRTVELTDEPGMVGPSSNPPSESRSLL